MIIKLNTEQLDLILTKFPELTYEQINHELFVINDGTARKYCRLAFNNDLENIKFLAGTLVESSKLLDMVKMRLGEALFNDKLIVNDQHQILLSNVVFYDKNFAMHLELYIEARSINPKNTEIINSYLNGSITIEEMINRVEDN